MGRKLSGFRSHGMHRLAWKVGVLAFAPVLAALVIGLVDLAPSSAPAGANHRILRSRLLTHSDTPGAINGTWTETQEVCSSGQTETRKVVHTIECNTDDNCDATGATATSSRSRHSPPGPGLRCPCRRELRSRARARSFLTSRCFRYQNG